MVNKENIKRVVAFIEEYKHSFGQSSGRTCLVGMIRRAKVGGDVGAYGGREEYLREAADFVGLPYELIRLIYRNQIPANDFGFDYNAYGAAGAKKAISYLNSFIPADTATENTDKKVLALLVFAGKVTQADVDAARALLN